MISIGNDIVSLALVNKERTRLPQFYHKILNAPEIELHSQCSLPFEQYVWLLWSIKEAVYKCAQRHNTALLFLPKKITVQQVEQIAGEFTSTASLDGNIFYGKSYVNNAAIHSIVSNHEHYYTGMYWGEQFIDEDSSENQSLQVRALALSKLSSIYKGTSLHITKTVAGCPVLLVDGAVTSLPISFSHHGNYVAYSFLDNL